MQDKKQGSQLGEMMDLSQKFIENAEIIFRTLHRKMIKNDEDLQDDIKVEFIGFGLASVMIQTKLSEWMKHVTQEMDILQKEESGSKDH